MNLKDRPALGVGSVTVVACETSGNTFVLPALVAAVAVIEAVSAKSTVAARAFSNSAIVTFLFIGVPEGSSTT